MELTEEEKNENRKFHKSLENFYQGLSEEKKMNLISLVISTQPFDSRDFNYRTNEEFEDYSGDLTPLDRSKQVYTKKTDYPQRTVTEICKIYGISEGIFRHYLSIHRDEWAEHYLNKWGYIVIEDALFLANDDQVEEFKKEVPNIPIEPFIIPTEL